MARIAGIVLRSRNPRAQIEFYCNVLGMVEFADQSVGYPGEGARLSFVPAETDHVPSADDLYWKIALAVPDLDLACCQLAEKGTPVGKPEQFGDIGYLAHLKDPEGFTIELIAHRFQGEASPAPIDPGLFGGGAVLNLLTLRCASEELIAEKCEGWGMKRLAIMPVERYGFTLHFYAFTDEEPPSADPRAIENRSWVYQRPYTVFEVQHRPSLAHTRLPAAGAAGYVETVFEGAEETVWEDVFGVRMEKV